MFSLLSNLGSGISKIGSTFAHGAAGVGKGAVRGLKKFGDLDRDEMSPTAPQPFSPAATRGIRSVEDAVADAESQARDEGVGVDFGSERRAFASPDLSDNPRAQVPIMPPALNNGPISTPKPQLPGMNQARPPRPADDWGEPPLTDPYDPRKLLDLSRLTSGAKAPEPPSARADIPISLPTRGAPLDPPRAFAAPVEDDRRDVPIPALPGRPGGPTPYDPINAARYDFVMKGAKQDEAGNLLGEEEGGGFKRSWKDVANNALQGFARAASRDPRNALAAGLGGAIAGGVGTAIDPMTGREYLFDTTERPRMEADVEGERTAREKAGAEALKQAQLQNIQAETGLREAQAKKALEPPQPKAERHTPAYRTVLDDDGQPVLVDMNAPENREKKLRPYIRPTKDQATKEPSTSEKLRQADTALTAAQGTTQKIATDSTNSRLGEIIDGAPDAIRSILQTGKKANGQPATPRDINQAKAYLDREWKKVYAQNLTYTRGVREQDKAKRAGGGTEATSQAPTANVKDLEKLWR